MELQTKRLILRAWKESDAVVLKETGEAVGSIAIMNAKSEIHTAIWCGYYDGNEKSKRAQEKCGFIYSHTEYNKPVPLLNEVRTEHYNKISFDDWKNNINNL